MSNAGDSAALSDSNRRFPSGTGRAAAPRVLLVGYGALTVSMLAIGLLLTAILDNSVGGWDTDVNRWFVSHRADTWNSFTSVATFMLNTVPVIVVAAVVVAVLALRHRWREALVLVFALILEITVFLSVTFVVDRPRPNVARLNSAPMTSSFPSGHTAAAVVLYGGIAFAVYCCTRRTPLRCAAWAVAIGVGTTVALSRVYRGMHHPTDVIIGALFGIVCLCVAVTAVRAMSNPADTATGSATTEKESTDVARPSEAIEWDVVA